MEHWKIRKERMEPEPQNEAAEGKLPGQAEMRQLVYELHDALAQTLFSANLIADVLPRLWARDPQEGLVRLDELRQLTRVALAEAHSLFAVLGLPADPP